MAAAGTLLYGVVRFPDAPIRPLPDGGYRGKSGQARTAEDYAAFKAWERTVVILFPSAVGAALVTAWVVRRSRSRPA